MGKIQTLSHPTSPYSSGGVSESEFVAWYRDQESTRAEWHDGEILPMAPDNTEHNDLIGFTLTLLRAFVRHHGLGRVFHERVQVRLEKLRARREPDLFFVAAARTQIIHENHIEGAPDLVMEFVSPESSARDYREKYREYEQAGVREYWIVDPLAQKFEVHGRDRRGKFRPIKAKNGAFHSRVLRGFYLRPEWLWQSPLPSELAIIREMGIK